MEQLGYPEQDGADWWQCQEQLEHLQRAQWAQEQAIRALADALEQQYRLEGVQFAAFRATLDAAITVLNALLENLRRS